MSILSTISTGIRSEGLRIVIAGQEKMGKTTLVSGAPAPLLIPLEIGYSGIEIAKTSMLQKYNDVESLLAEILGYVQQGEFPYRTLVFDSATALERMIHESIVEMENKRGATMESAMGGYGKAYTYANERFDNFLRLCDQLAVYYGINIILTCHVFAAKLIDPMNGEYDSWDLLLHSPKNQKTYGKREMITQWADVIAFLHEPMYITKDENVSKGVSANKGRMLGLSRTPAYVAGNRFGIEGEISIPKDDGWNHFAQAIYQSCGIDIYTR